jgi:hypothetical protein
MRGWPRGREESTGSCLRDRPATPACSFSNLPLRNRRGVQVRQLPVAGRTRLASDMSRRQLVVEIRRQAATNRVLMGTGQSDGMPPRERAVDQGTRRARVIEAELGAEIRRARVGGSLTQDEVGRACGITGAYVSQIERGLAMAPSSRARVTSVMARPDGSGLSGGSVSDAGHRAPLERLRLHLADARWRRGPCRAPATSGLDATNVGPPTAEGPPSARRRRSGDATARRPGAPASPRHQATRWRRRPRAPCACGDARQPSVPARGRPGIRP